MTKNDAMPLTTIDMLMPMVTEPTLGHSTFPAPARKSEAPINSKTKHAVVLTGMPKPENQHSMTVSTE